MTSFLSAVALAAAPAPSPPPPPPPPPPPSDESFIEFLGADDVGDAGWWDFLKKTDPQTATAPQPPEPKQ
jgi:hypothetical protein